MAGLFSDDVAPTELKTFWQADYKYFAPDGACMNRTAANRCRFRLVHGLERPTALVLAKVIFNAKAQRRKGAMVFV